MFYLIRPSSILLSLFLPVIGSVLLHLPILTAASETSPAPTPSSLPLEHKTFSKEPFASLGSPSPSATPLPAMDPITAIVGRILEQGHFLRLPINDLNPPHDETTPPLSMAQRVMKNYLQYLDYNHLYFTQADIEEFQKKYGETLTTDVLRGDLTAPRAIYQRFRERVETRVAKNKLLTSIKHDFSSNRTIELNRQKSPWPKNDTEADQLWNDRIEAELLQERLNKHSINSPVKVITHRYEQMLKMLHEQTDEDIVKTFLSALAESYDPHSEYMSPSDMENFNIQMRLSLVGIGALLRPDDGYTRIVEIIPGGPADRDGKLKANDRITAVAQGNQPFEDVIDLRLDKVVAKIRGKKGTKVRLQVIPAEATDPSKRVIIEISRDEVKLKESEAKAEIIELPKEAGKKEKYGWITLPAFYAEMDKRGNSEAKSTTKDVRCLLTRLKQENIQGLVIDLRRNGGGSLEEAINLTGLFIGPGPVVQVKDSSGKISISSDSDPAPFYNGPIIVLINRLSASASEIFAAALQDYHRAVIVGDERSFGKGTVQTLLDVGRFMPLFHGTQKAGSLKLTIQKFYRVSGGSTQHRGVLSDITLPSLTDNPEISENMLPNPLVYDEVPALKITPLSQNDLCLDVLKQHSAERVKKDLEFHTIAEKMKKMSEKIKANQLSLNEHVRRQELADEKKTQAQRKAERSVLLHPPFLEYDLTLDKVNQPKLTKIVPKKKKKDKSTKANIRKNHSSSDDDLDEEDDDINADANIIDPEKREAIAILNDLNTLRPTSNVSFISTK